MTDLDPRVIRGAAVLDEKLPDWWKKINLKKFDLADSTICVLGQVGMCINHTPHNYYWVCENIFGTDGDGGEWVREHGFFAACITDEEGEVLRDWDSRDAGLLERDWRMLIAERQSYLTSK